MDNRYPVIFNSFMGFYLSFSNLFDNLDHKFIALIHFTLLLFCWLILFIAFQLLLKLLLLVFIEFAIF